MENLPIELLLHIKDFLKGQEEWFGNKVLTRSLMNLASTSKSMKSLLYNNSLLWNDCNHDMLAIIIHKLPLQVPESVTSLDLKTAFPTISVVSCCPNLKRLSIDIAGSPRMKMKDLDAVFAEVGKKGQSLALKELYFGSGRRYLSPKTAPLISRIATKHLKNVCTDLIVYPTVCICRKGFCNYEDENPNRSNDDGSKDQYCDSCNSTRFDLVCRACESLPSCGYSRCSLGDSEFYSICCSKCAIKSTCDYCNRWICVGCCNTLQIFCAMCSGDDDGNKICCEECAPKHLRTQNMECAEGHGGRCELGCPDHAVGETCVSFSVIGDSKLITIALKTTSARRTPLECMIALHAVLLEVVLLVY